MVGHTRSFPGRTYWPFTAKSTTLNHICRYMTTVCGHTYNKLAKQGATPTMIFNRRYLTTPLLEVIFLQYTTVVRRSGIFICKWWWAVTFSINYTMLLLLVAQTHAEDVRQIKWIRLRKYGTVVYATSIFGTWCGWRFGIVNFGQLLMTHMALCCRRFVTKHNLVMLPPPFVRER